MTLLHPFQPDTDTIKHAEPVSAAARTPYRCWLTVLAGIGLGVVVGYSGTPAWQAIRVIFVIAVFAAGFVLQRSDRKWVPAISTVFGVVGVIAGISVGLMHLVKSGPAIPTAAGLVVMLAGIALLIEGSIRMIRLLPHWWRLLAIPGAYVVLEFVLFPVTMGVYAVNVPPGHLGNATPSSRGLTYTTVSFNAADGTRLAGWYVTSHNGAAVIVTAGSGSTRAAALEQGAVLARHGYGVLFIDNRGHGTSGGNAMDFGWWGERDLYGAVSFLENRADVTTGRIAILGESMGGEGAIGAIGADPRVRAVIAEGVTGRTFADTAWRANGITDLVSRAQAWITYTAAGLITAAPQPPSLVSSLRGANPRPVLIIAGKPELRADRYLKAQSPSNVQLLEMADTAHTAGLRTHPTQWETAVIRFLDQAL